MRRVVAVLGLLLVLMAALVLWFPARWALVLAGHRLHSLRLEGVHGTIWHGGAQRLSWTGQPLGQLQWTLSRQALLGDVHGQVALDDTHWQGRAHFRRTGPQALSLSDVHAKVPVAWLHPYLSTPLAPGGRLHADLSELVLREGWPVQLQGVLHWEHATLDDGRGAVPLGSLYARLEDQAGTRLLAHLGDDGHGPLSLHGQLDATPLGWRLDAVLFAREGDARLRALLSRFGTLDHAGRLHLRAHGGLTMGANP
jgi:general secretion pathway protein N